MPRSEKREEENVIDTTRPSKIVEGVSCLICKGPCTLDNLIGPDGTNQFRLRCVREWVGCGWTSKWRAIAMPTDMLPDKMVQEKKKQLLRWGEPDPFSEKNIKRADQRRRLQMSKQRKYCDHIRCWNYRMKGSMYCEKHG